MLSTYASVLGDHLFENLLILYFHGLALLSTNVDVDVAITYVPVPNHQKPRVFCSEGVHHFLPLGHIEGHVVSIHSALFDRSISNILADMPDLPKLFIIVRHYRIHEVGESFQQALDIFTRSFDE